MGGSSLAVVDREDSGPQFGADGLKILLKGSGDKERTAQVSAGNIPFVHYMGCSLQLCIRDHITDGVPFSDLEFQTKPAHA